MALFRGANPVSSREDGINLTVSRTRSSWCCQWLKIGEKLGLAPDVELFLPAIDHHGGLDLGEPVFGFCEELDDGGREACVLELGAFCDHWICR